MHIRRLLFASALSWLSLASVAHAQEQHVSIDFSAPDACPDVGRFSDEVSARLGYVPFREGESRLVRVRILPDGQGWLGTLEVDEAQPRIMRGSQCEEVGRDLAAAVAVVLNPAPAPRDQVPPPPQQQPAPPTSGGQGVPVRLTITSDRELDQISAHRQIGSGSGFGGGGGVAVAVYSQYHERLCVLPCEARLEVGTHQLALSEGVGAASNLPELTTIDGPSYVHIEHSSYRGTRVTGTILMTLGVLAMSLSPLVLLMGDDVGVEPVLGVLAGGGVATGVGFAMMLTSDDVDITVTPFGG